MAYQLIIAEKPSVAASIAKVVGAREAHRNGPCGYLEGNGYRVSWAFGHLAGLKTPEEMGFTGETLPILPQKWPTKVLDNGKDKKWNETVARQVKTLDGLMGGAERIIVATDAGREGELIFRYIYEHLGCRTPFDRLWISSLTDEAIRKGMKEILPGSRMDALSKAAHARSEADWLVGYNASRALRTASQSGRNLSLGRVQTPVLCMIVERFEANRDFKPTPYWQVTALVNKDMTPVPVASVNRYPTAESAEQIRAAVEKHGTFLVKGVESKEVVSRPPLLYDLTALQRDANRRCSLTADQTLRIAQSLYEKKYLSYPRTGSRYIPEDVFRTIPEICSKLESYPRESFQAAARQVRAAGPKACRRSVDDSKVTDHHALLPTGILPTDLSGEEKTVWEMVYGRMLEAFGENSVARRTTVELECANIPFRTSGSVPVKAGWKAVFGEADEPAEEKDTPSDETPEAGALPEFRQGESVPGTKVESVRKTDKPLPVYNDASLLGEMETCGKKIDDEELRETMKDTGLGTPATRAATIETLITRGYVERKAKKLLPTELGTEVAHAVRGRRIADVRTTGEWERDLSLIEQGKASKEDFDRRIRTYVEEIIEDITTNCRGLSGSSGKAYACPFCGKNMQRLKFSYACPEKNGGCGASVPVAAAGKTLPETAVEALMALRTTQVIKGFKSQSGKSFDAALRMNPQTRRGEFVFPGSEAMPALEGTPCPCCGLPMHDKGRAIACGCGLAVYKSYGEKPLSEEEIRALLSGREVEKKNMRNKAGKTYSATLLLSREEKKIEFKFPDTPRKGNSGKKTRK